MTLYFLKYNNYYNRIHKKEKTLNDYLAYEVETITGVDLFNPNDDVITEHVLNYEIDGHPDYMLVCDEDDAIVSRWFVLESTRLLNGQARLQLQRDLITDYFDQVINAPMYLHKATINVNDEAIYNEEDFQVNQIKTSETLLKDRTQNPWLVGYIARNTESKTISIPEDPIKVDYPDGISTVPFNDKTAASPFIGPINNVIMKFPITFTETDRAYYAHWTKNGSGESAPLDPDDKVYTDYLFVATDLTTTKYVKTSMSRDDFVINLGNTVRPQDWNGYPYSSFWEGDNNPMSAVDTETFLELQDKVVYDNGKYYRIKINYGAKQVKTNLAVTQNSSLDLAIRNVAKTAANVSSVSNGISFLDLSAPSYYITYEELSLSTLSTTIQSNHVILNDAPYDMFCLPYGDVNILGVTNSAKTNFRIVQGLIKELGSNLYDLQLLPYCPLPQNAIGNKSIDVTQLSGSAGKVTSVITSNDLAVGYIIWCTSSSFELTIDHPITVPSDAIEFKVANQCDFYRLCSPNYNGQFEFKATRNRGVSRFTVDCTYKPFQPYIRVAPDFNGLYGKDFNDARGLICGGDFSLSLISDKWEQYQIDNKNFNNIFDRQISNLEFTQGQERTQAYWNMATGALTGGSAGAFGGSMIPIPGGAGIGFGVGAAASLGAGIADVVMLKDRQAETLDYTKDLYNLNMQNIKALPQSLTRVSAYTANNKLFPVLEYYTCTETEKESFRNKLIYNGFTVNRIGTIKDFYQTTDQDLKYIKGQLIRLSVGDFHLVSSIAEELNKGVFL